MRTTPSSHFTLYLSCCVRFETLVDSLTQQTGIPQSHMELFFDNHPFKPPSYEVKDLPITTVSMEQDSTGNINK